MATALALIDAIAAQREQLRGDAVRSARLARLQQRQIERLRRTYDDFGRNKRYASALDFFADDLYGPHEYTQRDADLRKVLRSWERLLPRLALRAVVAALELESLSLNLDVALTAALGAEKLHDASYAHAYRMVGRRDDRLRQIELIIDAGHALNRLIHLPAIGAALRMARTPAKLARVTALHGFLERGYSAFAHMRDATPLLEAIETRELRIMQALFENEATPFRTARTK